MAEDETEEPRLLPREEQDEAPRRVLAGRVGFLLLALIAAAVGAMGGLFFIYSTDLPQIGELEEYRPSSITELYDDQGREIGADGPEGRRMPAANVPSPLFK